MHSNASPDVRLLAFEALSKAIQVRHLQTPLNQVVSIDLQVSEQAAHDRLSEHGFDNAPVVDGKGELVGRISRADLTSESKEPIVPKVQPIAERMLVTGGTPLPNLLQWMVDDPLLLVLDGRDITGLVTPADFNKQAARTYFYLLVADFEMVLASFIRFAYADDEGALERLSPARAQKVRDLYDSACERDINADHISVMNLSDLVSVAGRTPAILAEYGYPSRKRWDKATGFIDHLRNRVMHPARLLLETPNDLDHLVDQEQRLRHLIHPEPTSAAA